MPSSPWWVTAILMTTCSTWSAGRNWNLLVSFTRSHIRGFRILESFIIDFRHQANLMRWNIVPLDVFHWILLRRKYPRDQRVLVTQSPVYQPRNLRGNYLHWFFWPFLPDLYHGCHLSGNIVLRLGQSWMICKVGVSVVCPSNIYSADTYPHMSAWWRLVVCRSHWSLQQHLTINRVEHSHWSGGSRSCSHWSRVL